MKLAFIMAGTVLLLCGCAGSRCRVTARSVPQPVSCTSCVFDSSGNIRAARPEEVVEHIEFTKTHWSMFWAALSLSRREWDLSPEINQHLEASSGNAVVNLKVETSACNPIHGCLASLVGIIPSYNHVRVVADVVRMNESEP